MKKLFKVTLLICIIILSITQFSFAVFGKTANTVKIGDYFQIGSYNNEKILWRCVDIDKNGPLLLTNKIISYKAFDEPGSSNKGSHSRGSTVDKFIYTLSQQKIRQVDGSNYWADSNIKDWLNSDADSGKIKWSCGNPPTYKNEAGFLSNFTKNEKSLIKEVTQKTLLDANEYSYTKNRSYLPLERKLDDMVKRYNSAFGENTTDRVFLLDINQLGNVYKNLPDYLTARPTESALKNSVYYKNIYAISNSCYSYWLRTPYSFSSGNNGNAEVSKKFSESCFTMTVDKDGKVSYSKDDNGDIGIRSAFYIDISSLTFKDGKGTQDKPYTIE